MINRFLFSISGVLCFVLFFFFFFLTSSSSIYEVIFSKQFDGDVANDSRSLTPTGKGTCWGGAGGLGHMTLWGYPCVKEPLASMVNHGFAVKTWINFRLTAPFITESCLIKPNAILFGLYGCVWLRNSDLDFEIRISDFAIEREIRKRISPPRNQSSGWISIKKPKSGFHGFPFCLLFFFLSEKGFVKLFSWTAVFFLLFMLARARPLFLRTVFEILFRILAQTNGKKKIQKQIS